MKADLCPECGSAKVEMSGPGGVILPAGPANCHACGWSGTMKDLMHAQVPELESLSQDAAHAIALEVAATYQALLAQIAAQPIGVAMVQSGMVGMKDTKNLTRMIRAATLGAHKATLEEVEKIQKESQSGGSGN